ncbi:MAG: hypothetical protein IKV32_07025 [Muribaculaceae bacterium]|nr:hypothetical protein [Muribaculaceae bacterium]
MRTLIIIFLGLIFFSCTNHVQKEDKVVNTSTQEVEQLMSNEDIYVIPYTLHKKYPNRYNNQAVKESVIKEMEAYLNKYKGQELPMVSQSSLFLDKVEKDGESGYRALFNYGWISSEDFESKIQVWVLGLTHEEASKLNVAESYYIKGKMCEISYSGPELYGDVFDFGIILYEDATISKDK